MASRIRAQEDSRSHRSGRSKFVVIKTTGDKLQNRFLRANRRQGCVSSRNLKKLFLSEEIDLAVHSVKDIPTEVPSRLCFPVICRREDIRDCLVAATGETLAALRRGARIGTSSLSPAGRKCSTSAPISMCAICAATLTPAFAKWKAANMMPFCWPKPGSIASAGAIASAKFSRLRSACPAVGQGALGVQGRLKDHDLAEALAPLDDFETRQSIVAERALLAALEGGCQVPLGAWARFERGELAIDAVVCSPRWFAACSPACYRSARSGSRAWATRRTTSHRFRRARNSRRGLSAAWVTSLHRRSQESASSSRRAESQSATLAAALRAHGAEVVSLPLIQNSSASGLRSTRSCSP